MAETLKLPGQEPKRDLSGTTVYIAEYNRSTLHVIQRWTVHEYERKADATASRGIVAELLDGLFPDPTHTGSRPLTEQDLCAMRLIVAGRLAERTSL